MTVPSLITLFKTVIRQHSLLLSYFSTALLWLCEVFSTEPSTQETNKTMAPMNCCKKSITGTRSAWTYQQPTWYREGHLHSFSFKRVDFWTFCSLVYSQLPRMVSGTWPTFSNYLLTGWVDGWTMQRALKLISKIHFHDKILTFGEK